jgi:WD40 repeat protein
MHRMVKYVALTLGLVFVLRLAHREPGTHATPAANAAPSYRGVITFATTGNGDPFHPAVVQDLDLASGQLTVRFDGLDASRPRTGELAFVQRLAPGVYADHGIVVVDARGVPGAPVFICKGFHISDNRTCAVPKLAPSGRLVAFVTVGSGKVCDGGYGMKWGSSVVVTDRQGNEVARFEGYTAPEWLSDGRLLMMGTQCRRGGIWLADASLRSMSRVDGDQVNTPAASPAVSPDGKTLAFVWNNQLWSLRLVGAPELTQLTAMPKPVTAAAWSPDGSAIAALMFDVSMPVRSMALFRPGDQKSVVFRDLGVYPYGPISWR